MPSETYEWATNDPLRNQVTFVRDDSFIPKKHCCTSCGDGGECEAEPGEIESSREYNAAGSMDRTGSTINFDPPASPTGNLLVGAFPGPGFSIPSWSQLFQPQGPTVGDPGLGKRIRRTIQEPEVPDGPGGNLGPGGTPLQRGKLTDQKVALKRLNELLFYVWVMCFKPGASGPKELCACFKLRLKPTSFADFKRQIKSIAGSNRTCRQIKRMIELAARAHEYAEAGYTPPKIEWLPPIGPSKPAKEPRRTYIGPAPRLTGHRLEELAQYLFGLLEGIGADIRDYDWPKCKGHSKYTKDWWQCIYESLMDLLNIRYMREWARIHSPNVTVRGLGEASQWMRTRTGLPYKRRVPQAARRAGSK